MKILHYFIWTDYSINYKIVYCTLLLCQVDRKQLIRTDEMIQYVSIVLVTYVLNIRVQ